MWVRTMCDRGRGLVAPQREEEEMMGSRHREGSGVQGGPWLAGGGRGRKHPGFSRGTCALDVQAGVPGCLPPAGPSCLCCPDRSPRPGRAGATPCEHSGYSCALASHTASPWPLPDEVTKCDV